MIILGIRAYYSLGMHDFCLLSFSSRSSCIVGELGDIWILTVLMVGTSASPESQCTWMMTCWAKLWVHFAIGSYL